MNPRDLEAIRRTYRPRDGLRVLLLGESPPPGRGFFYTGDSTLYKFTVAVLMNECGFPSEPSEFLRRFAAAGFFLDDFSAKRGDKPGRRAADGDVRAAVGRIADLISTEGPLVVVGVLLSLQDLVAEAVGESEAPDTPWECLHFPHPRNVDGQRQYQNGLRRIVRRYGCD